MKQCKFLDIESNEVHGGILNDDGSIICGCCGGLIEADEVGDKSVCTAKIINVYETWVNLDETICDSSTTYTAFAYEDGVAVDESTYDDADEAISFAKNRGWDEVVDDLSGKIIWHNIESKVEIG